MRTFAAAALISIVSTTQAFAEIRVFMDNWPTIPHVHITKGAFEDCSANATVYENAMQTGWEQVFVDAGSTGDSICYRRTKDPGNPNSGLTTWTVCQGDGDCEIE